MIFLLSVLRCIAKGSLLLKYLRPMLADEIRKYEANTTKNST